MCTNYRWDFWFFSAMNTKKATSTGWFSICFTWSFQSFHLSGFMFCVYGKRAKAPLSNQTQACILSGDHAAFPVNCAEEKAAESLWARLGSSSESWTKKPWKTPKAGGFTDFGKTMELWKKCFFKGSLTEIYLGCLGWKGLFNKFAFHAPLHPSHQSQIQIPNLLDNSWKQRLIHEGSMDYGDSE